MWIFVGHLSQFLIIVGLLISVFENITKLLGMKCKLLVSSWELKMAASPESKNIQSFRLNLVLIFSTQITNYGITREFLEFMCSKANSHVYFS